MGAVELLLLILAIALTILAAVRRVDIVWPIVAWIAFVAAYFLIPG